MHLIQDLLPHTKSPKNPDLHYILLKYNSLYFLYIIPDVISLYETIIKNVEKRINDLIENKKKISKIIKKESTLLSLLRSLFFSFCNL